MRVALLITDNREQAKDYAAADPYFGTAPEALLAGMNERPGLEVHVVSCLRAEAPAPEKLGPNIWYHSVVVPKIGWMSTGYQGCIRAVRRKLREIGPDIVHGQGTERDCAMEAVFSGYPNVVTLHGNMCEVARFMKAKPWSYHGLTVALERLALGLTGGVFCNSSHTEAIARPMSRKRWLVPNPLRPHFFLPPSEAQAAPSRKVINIGTVCPYKRQVELLDLAERLHREGAELEFLFLGGIVAGAYGTAFEERIARGEKAGYARYLGTLPPQEIVPLLDGCGAMVHLSAVESFGLAVAEGLARNLKFFGVRTGGVVDIAHCVEGAELYNPDDIGALGQALADWARAGCPKPTRAAAVMQERYHPETIALRHLEIYREVLGAA